MTKLLKKFPKGRGLSLTSLTAVFGCGLCFAAPTFAQSAQSLDHRSTPHSVTHDRIEPIFGHTVHEDLFQDLPSYRMAKEAVTEPTNSQQPSSVTPLPGLPTPWSQSVDNSHAQDSRSRYPQTHINSVQSHDKSEPASHSARVEKRVKQRSVETHSQPTGTSRREYNLEFTIPTLASGTSQTWTRLELTEQNAKRTLANPLQRYEPLFRHDRPYAPATLTHPYGTVPLVLNRHVERNLNYFQNGIPERFQSYLDRYAKYQDLVEQIFKEFGLPTELGHLSLVESGFNPRAYSRARASGPWQFMKATGRMYGLNVTWYVDERRDPVKSTIAAAHHLRDLYDRFGSWPLALGAYNAGGGKISRAIRRTGSRDFWKIRNTWYIRRETKEYVPRFVAATLIASHPTDYGFIVKQVDPYSYDEVLMHKRVHLKAVAKTTGISFEDLRELNPELRRSIVPALRKGYPLKVPAGTGPLVKKQHDRIKPWTQPPPPATTWYRVRYGDSLSVVAKRFGMKVRALKNLNRLSGNLIRVGDRLRVREKDAPIDLKSRWYRVRRGDNLSKIAKRFGTTTRSLKNLNNLSGHLIHVGDKLQVRGKAPASTPRSNETKWYRVRRGDSLWTIAKRFRVSVTDLKVLNNLTTSVIRAGKLLLVSQ
ncbi:LysM peptidoglycan-binding domain-containing protein [Nitrospira sp. M1]